jgi:hypothetical protein
MRPIFWLMAPVNAPFSWPNNSLSSRPVGIAAQFSLTSVLSLRRLRSWIARAKSSCPSAGFAEQQDCRVGGRDRFDQLQNVLERRA